MTAPEAFQFFKETFNLPFNEYLDSALCALTCKPVLDVCKFDDWLHENYGKYEAEGKSMQDVLTEHYGAETAEKIQSLLG